MIMVRYFNKITIIKFTGYMYTTMAFLFKKYALPNVFCSPFFKIIHIILIKYNSKSLFAFNKFEHDDNDNNDKS